MLLQVLWINFVKVRQPNLPKISAKITVSATGAQKDLRWNTTWDPLWDMPTCLSPNQWENPEERRSWHFSWMPKRSLRCLSTFLQIHIWGRHYLDSLCRGMLSATSCASHSSSDLIIWLSSDLRNCGCW